METSLSHVSFCTVAVLLYHSYYHSHDTQQKIKHVVHVITLEKLKNQWLIYNLAVLQFNSFGFYKVICRADFFIFNDNI